MGRRAIAVDLDGTLLNSQRTLSPRNTESLLRAAEQGWIVILCTARPVRAISAVVPDSFDRFYWAACNGAWLLKDREMLLRNEIPGDTVCHLIDRFNRKRWPFQVEADDRMYTDRGVPSDFVGEYFPLSQFGRRNACKVIVNVASSEDSHVVAEMLPSGCASVVTDNGALVQISHAECHKLAAVRHILAQEGVSMEDTFAFGDDYNDMPLVQAVGVGVAMMNAVPALKDAARHITASNDEDGVAQFLDSVLTP